MASSTCGHGRHLNDARPGGGHPSNERAKQHDYSFNMSALAHATYHHKCCSFSKVPWEVLAWWWIRVIIVSLQTPISQVGRREWGWLSGTPCSLQPEEQKPLLVLLCSVVAAVIVPTFPPVEPGPDTVVPSPGAGGSGAGEMGAFWKGGWGFSSLWVRWLLLSYHWRWWWTFLSSFGWLIVLISRIPHFCSALEGQGRLQYCRWSAHKASQSHLLWLLFHCQNLCYGHLAPVRGVEHNSANCHQRRLGPLCWKIPAFQDTLILLELFYFVCSKAGQVTWHCWARLLKAFINTTSFVTAEDRAPQPAEDSTFTSVKTSRQQCWPLWLLCPRKRPVCPASGPNTLYFGHV